jgi:hypothetical protein
MLDQPDLAAAPAYPDFAPAANDAAPQALRLTFTGSGAEYFRIWVVNLLLTLATLGIYSAWAKVRRLQYFDRNTQLAGATFDFHGAPRPCCAGACWRWRCRSPTNTRSVFRWRSGWASSACCCWRCRS